MSEEFKFSDPGEGLQEAEVLEIHVDEGSHVNDGDTILTVETDKAATDIQAPFTGKVEKVQVKTGDVVRVDDVLLSYAPDGDEKSTDSDETQEDQEENKKEEKEKGDDEKDAEQGDDESSAEPDRESAEETEEPEEVSEKDQHPADEEQQDERREKEEEESAEEDEKQEKQKDTKGKRDQPPVPAAPSTRRLARERGVDLHDVDPSGPQGRVTPEDVETAAKAAERSAPGKASGEKAQTTALPDFSQWGDTEREPMRSIRRITAQRMAQSWQEVPHVYHQDIADITELERFRHEYETTAQANGGKFTLTILVMKALVYTLKQFPRFNASLDDQNQEIVLKHYFNIGVAAATDKGLLVPVIREVDRMNLIELTEAVTATVEKARNGELGREDMQGGSITLTNPGPLGGTSLSPLINLPEVAILGLGQARLEPVVHGSLDNYEVKPRLLLPLSLGFDHRVNDGADAANFVTTLIGALEDPQSLLLKI